MDCALIVVPRVSVRVHSPPSSTTVTYDPTSTAEVSAAHEAYVMTTVAGVRPGPGAGVTVTVGSAEGSGAGVGVADWLGAGAEGVEVASVDGPSEGSEAVGDGVALGSSEPANGPQSEDQATTVPAAARHSRVVMAMTSHLWERMILGELYGHDALMIVADLHCSALRRTV